MTPEQEDTIFAAYMTICKHKRYVTKWGPDDGAEKIDKQLREIGEVFPFIPIRVARLALRS